KALKQFVEPLVTQSETDDTHNRRVVFSYMRSKSAVTALFREVAPEVGDRRVGYTRIVKLGSLLGANAEIAMIELVDFNELYNGGKKEVKIASTRRGRKKATAKTEEAPVAEVEETVADVETPTETKENNE